MILFENIIWIFFAHFVGDAGLRPDWIIDRRDRTWFIIASHAIVWTACVSISLKYIGILSLGKIAFLLLGHFASDFIRSKVGGSVYTDQIWHFSQLLIVYFL